MKLVVYGIYDKRVEECVYTGSTELDHWRRFGQHLDNAFLPSLEHLPLYQYLREQGPEHFIPRVIEAVTLKAQLRQREQFHQDRLSPRCNVRKAWLTEEEKMNYHSNYKKNNPEKFAMYRETRKRKLKAMGEN